jgi:hypothetical protein
VTITESFFDELAHNWHTEFTRQQLSDSILVSGEYSIGE